MAGRSRWVGAALSLGGLALLTAAVFEWWGATRTQAALAERWAGGMPDAGPAGPAVEGGGVAAEAAGAGTPAEAPPGAPTGAPVRHEFAQGEPLFRLRIPKIDLVNIVVWGSTETALRKGPGLIEGTALPGEGGNVVIGAHRDYYFWRLHELAPGDRLTVEMGGRVREYSVTESRVVQETDTSILAPSAGEQLTLFTCWPLFFAGRSPERLVVMALPVSGRRGGDSR
jgi:LPXTG-site transpeptidase (sortase) family protein